MTADDHPNAEELRQLAAKYATLAELRRARARGEPHPPAAFYRRLAEAYPGCLRELDSLPLAMIEARADALLRAAADGVTEPWMAWIWGYHALMRAALSAPPPRGRLNARVLAALERAHGVPAEQIARALFPSRRT